MRQAEAAGLADLPPVFSVRVANKGFRPPRGDGKNQ